MQGFAVEIDPDREFAALLKDARDKVHDLTVPLRLMSREWFKGNRAIFALKGPGKYTDLAPDNGQSKYPYKEKKQRAWGHVYPILQASGGLMRSLTDPSDANAVNMIIDRQTLILGTRIQWAYAHQFGSIKRKLPKRPFLLLGPEQVAPEGINRRRDAWVEMLKNWLTQVLAQGGN
jgi:phage gpG-like protein